MIPCAIAAIWIDVLSVRPARRCSLLFVFLAATQATRRTHIWPTKGYWHASTEHRADKLIAVDLAQRPDGLDHSTTLRELVGNHSRSQSNRFKGLCSLQSSTFLHPQAAEVPPEPVPSLTDAWPKRSWDAIHESCVMCNLSVQRVLQS